MNDISFTIEQVTRENYHLFDDMVYWRVNGKERRKKIKLVNTRFTNTLSMNFSIKISKYMRLYIMGALSAGYHVFIFRRLDTGRRDIYILMNCGLLLNSEEKVLPQH